MNTINTIYSLGLVAIYFIMGGEFTFWLVLVSAMIAAIPFTTTIFFFLLPIGILIWSFWITSSTVYDSDFAWLCIAYTPFYYTSWLSIIIDGVKGIFGD
jgi:hypothetical protein